MERSCHTLSTYLTAWNFSNISPLKHNGARIRFQESGQQVQSSSLARTIRANKANDFTSLEDAGIIADVIILFNLTKSDYAQSNTPSQSAEHFRTTVLKVGSNGEIVREIKR